ICLLRHGETLFNADGNRYCGRTDVGLTKKGLAQARRVNRLLKNIDFDKVYSSPLCRARITAEIAIGDPERVTTDERLIEIDFGQWEGRRPAEFINENPEVWNNWLADPFHHRAGGSGESGEEV